LRLTVGLLALPTALAALVSILTVPRPGTPAPQAARLHQAAPAHAGLLGGPSEQQTLGLMPRLVIR
jgi:hypothetical protein